MGIGLLRQPLRDPQPRPPSAQLHRRWLEAALPLCSLRSLGLFSGSWVRLCLTSGFLLASIPWPYYACLTLVSTEPETRTHRLRSHIAVVYALDPPPSPSSPNPTPSRTSSNKLQGTEANQIQLSPLMLLNLGIAPHLQLDLPSDLSLSLTLAPSPIPSPTTLQADSPCTAVEAVVSLVSHPNPTDWQPICSALAAHFAIQRLLQLNDYFAGTAESFSWLNS